MISVVIPVKDGGEDLVRCLEGVRRQQIGDDVEVVVVDSGSRDGSVARARAFGADVHEIPPEEFDHGATRNLGAELASGSILVFTSQDAVAASDDWLATLVAPLRSGDETVAGVYGRQLPHPTARPPERYFLDFLYGPEPRTQRLEDAGELRFEATLFSNVNSAMRRAVWEKYRFADDIVMSEDQEWSRRVLLAGMVLVYEPHAAVVHSHAYTPLSAFRRFFDSGASAERSYVSEARASRRALLRGALDYAEGEVAWLWRTRQRRWLAYATLYEGAKLAGLQLGLRHRHLPLAVKRRFSARPTYWERTMGAEPDRRA